MPLSKYEEARKALKETLELKNNYRTEIDLVLNNAKVNIDFNQILDEDAKSIAFIYRQNPELLITRLEKFLEYDVQKLNYLYSTSVLKFLREELEKLARENPEIYGSLTEDEFERLLIEIFQAEEQYRIEFISDKKLFLDFRHIETEMVNSLLTNDFIDRSDLTNFASILENHCEALVKIYSGEAGIVDGHMINNVEHNVLDIEDLINNYNNNISTHD